MIQELFGTTASQHTALWVTGSLFLLFQLKLWTTWLDDPGPGRGDLELRWFLTLMGCLFWPVLGPIYAGIGIVLLALWLIYQAGLRLKKIRQQAEDTTDEL